MNKILIDNIIRNYPFLIKIGAAKHFVFQQNLSSAYFKERPDTTRAQLPIREEFDEIKKSEIFNQSRNYEKHFFANVFTLITSVKAVKF